MKEQPIPQTI